MEAPGLSPHGDLKAYAALSDEHDRHQEGIFILRLHWGVALLTPVLTILSGRVTRPAVWFILGLFVLFTASVQAFVSLRPDRSAWPRLGFAILVSDLFLVTALVWARGGLATDAYQFYHLIIVGASILFGIRESLGFALAAGVLYGLVLFWDARSAAVLERVAIRTVYFVLTGIAAAYLSFQERRQRLARVQAQRLLADLQEAHTQLKVYAREMSQRAVTDGLTGLYNHTYFHQRLHEELGRTERYGRPLSLLMLDLDDFKIYNDRHGHLKGDEVLAQVARIITDSVRKVDIVCRYGGEEFAVIMPETDTPSALAAAERIRRAVEEALPLRPVAESTGAAGPKVAAAAPTPAGPIAPNPACPDSGRRLTVSIGVATSPRHATSRVALIEAADRALYCSKRKGKNLVSVSETGTPVETGTAVKTGTAVETGTARPPADT